MSDQILLVDMFKWCVPACLGLEKAVASLHRSGGGVGAYLFSSSSETRKLNLLIYIYIKKLA